MVHSALLRDNDSDKHRTGQAATSPCVFERRNIQTENTHENEEKTAGKPQGYHLNPSLHSCSFHPHTHTYTAMYKGQEHPTEMKPEI